MNLQSSKPVVSPGINMPTLSEEDNPFLGAAESNTIRQLVARCNFIAQDRPDVQYSVKELARGMANPRMQDMERVVRLGKYIVGKTMYVMVF